MASNTPVINDDFMTDLEAALHEDAMIMRLQADAYATALDTPIKKIKLAKSKGNYKLPSVGWDAVAKKVKREGGLIPDPSTLQAVDFVEVEKKLIGAGFDPFPPLQDWQMKPTPFWEDDHPAPNPMPDGPPPKTAPGKWTFEGFGPPTIKPPIPYREGDFVDPIKSKPIGITMVSHEAIKTQKAKGFAYSYQHKITEGVYGTGYGTASRSDLPPGHARLLPQCAWPDRLDHPMFARPCPLTPRHGFVESRIVTTLSEAKAVFDEARKEDPQAEMILMEPLSAKWSGVATSKGVSWGWGNDGVTSNTSRSVAIPTPATSPEHLKLANYHRFGQLSHIGIMNGDDIYFELVEHKNLTRLVQMRAGPPQPTTKNFIPRDTWVEKILHMDSYNLLDWEAIILKHKNARGVVVHLPNTALSSHWAVHAITHGIPVYTEQYLELGRLLKEETLNVAPLAPADYDTIADHILRFSQMDFMGDHRDEHHWRRRSEMITTAFASIHAMPLWGPEPHLLAMRGFAMAASMRFIAAASYGELRHWFGQGPGRHGRKFPCALIGADTAYSFDISQTRDRTAVYEKLLMPASTQVLYKALKCAEKGFRAYGWGDGENNTRRHRGDDTTSSSGYGGKNWANVARGGRDLASAVDSFLHYPSEALWTRVVSTANIALHTAHNNGHCVNKWVSSNTLNALALAPVMGFMNSFAAETVLGYNPKS